MWCRCGIHWHGCSAPTNSHDGTFGENGRHQWANHWQLYILDFLHTHRSASRSAPVFFRLASQIWYCQQTNCNSIATLAALDQHTILTCFTLLITHDTLSLSALSSAIIPPLSLFFASASRHPAINFDNSLTFTPATLIQCNSATASTGNPPNFAI
jgi:hypothetical protein